MKNLPRFIVDKRNNSSTRRFNKLRIRRRNVRNILSVVEAAGGTVPGVTEDSDDRPEIEAAADRCDSRSSSRRIRLILHELPRSRGLS